MTLLALDGIGVSLGGRPVLDDVSLTIGRGELVGLIGPNGAGKSTLLRAVVGLVPSQGGIGIDGKDAARLTERERARTIAFLPQEREVAWPVTVARLVALGRAPHRAAFSLPGPRDAQAVDEAMRRADVTAFADRPATELSGGEKARVLIARALAQEAPLLLADEPTAGLDPAHQIGLMRVFADLVRDGGSVVVSLHELGLAARWCTRLILLDRGRVAADGSPAEVLTRERLRDVYGIEAFLGEAGGGMVLHPIDLAETQPAR